MKDREKTEYIIIHCSATPPTMNIGADTIDRWHRSRGIASRRGPTGYHYIIRRDGMVELGRDSDAIGAHCRGWNDRSVGICLVGGINIDGDAEENYTDEQWVSLRETVEFMKVRFPDAEIAGHGEFNTSKDCPCFDVREWARIGGLQ